MVIQAEALANRVLASESDAQGRVRLAYRTVSGREPIDAELQLGLEFLDGCQQDDEHDRWTQYAHVLLASNELLIID